MALMGVYVVHVFLGIGFTGVVIGLADFTV